MLLRRKLATAVWLCILVAIVGTAWAVTYTKGRLGVEDVRYKYGTFSVPTSANGTMTIHGMTPINALQRGVTGDGSTDDTDSLQAIISEVASVGGGSIYLPRPASSYRITSTITVGSNTNIVGDGFSNIYADTANCTMFRVDGGDSNVRFSGLLFTGRGAKVTGGRACIDLNPDASGETRYVTIDNCTFNNPSVCGVGTDPARDLTITNCTFRNVGEHGVYLSHVFNATVSNCLFDSSTAGSAGYAIYLRSNDGTTYNGGRFVISGNNIKNFYRGIVAADSNSGIMSIAGNIIHSCDNNGINFTQGMTGQLLVTGNTISECGNNGMELTNVAGGSIGSNLFRGNAQSGIRLNDCNRVTITGNSFYANTGTAAYADINFDGTSNGNSVLGNAFYGTNASGYCIKRQDADATTKIMVCGNVFAGTYAAKLSAGRWYPSMNFGEAYASAFMDTLFERQSGNGVVIDNVRVRDAGVRADSLYERTSGAGLWIDGVHSKDSILRTTSARLDSVVMKTALHGVVIDPVPPITTAARTTDDSLDIAENVVWFTGQTATVFCTLPTYATVPTGKRYTIINADAADTVFVEANGAELLNGSALRRAVSILPNAYATASFMKCGSTVGWVKVD